MNVTWLLLFCWLFLNILPSPTSGILDGFVQCVKESTGVKKIGCLWNGSSTKNAQDGGSQDSSNKHTSPAQSSSQLDLTTTPSGSDVDTVQTSTSPNTPTKESRAWLRRLRRKPSAGSKTSTPKPPPPPPPRAASVNGPTRDSKGHTESEYSIGSDQKTALDDYYKGLMQQCQENRHTEGVGLVCTSIKRMGKTTLPLYVQKELSTHVAPSPSPSQKKARSIFTPLVLTCYSMRDSIIKDCAIGDVGDKRLNLEDTIRKAIELDCVGLFIFMHKIIVENTSWRVQQIRELNPNPNDPLRDAVITRHLIIAFAANENINIYPTTMYMDDILGENSVELYSHDPRKWEKYHRRLRNYVKKLPGTESNGLVYSFIPAMPRLSLRVRAMLVSDRYYFLRPQTEDDDRLDEERWEEGAYYSLIYCIHQIEYELTNSWKLAGDAGLHTTGYALIRTIFEGNYLDYLISRNVEAEHPNIDKIKAFLLGRKIESVDPQRVHAALEVFSLLSFEKNVLKSLN